MILWDNSCSVTGCSNKEFLVASHIKPWAVCNQNNEWLNPYNGLLLTPNLDKAFDQGFISFDKSIKVKYQTLELQTRIKTYTGFTAQIIQHEVDHCDGVYGIAEREAFVRGFTLGARIIIEVMTSNCE